MTKEELDHATRTELYLEVQRGRLQETEGKVRKQAALETLHRRFPQIPKANSAPRKGEKTEVIKAK